MLERCNTLSLLRLFARDNIESVIQIQAATPGVSISLAGVRDQCYLEREPVTDFGFDRVSKDEQVVFGGTKAWL
jgi:hypothetical protein